jgi:CBS-domain-containing membrane protein
MTETTAKEIMTRDLVRATEDMTVEEALKALINHRITGLPVVDKKGKMMGVLSEFDVLRQLAKTRAKSQDVFQEKIDFTTSVESIQDDTPLSQIVKGFIDTKYRRLPVVDKAGKLVGIITRRDLMRVYYYRARLAD